MTEAAGTSVRRLGRTALAVLGVLILLLVVAGFFSDRLATAATNRLLSESFPVPASVRSVHVGLLSGRVTLEGLRIANPAGYAHPEFLVLRRGQLHVRLLSLRSAEVVVDLIRTEGLTVRIENAAGRRNVDEIFPRKGPGGKKDEGGKRIAVRRIVLRGTTVSFPMGGGEQIASVEEIVLDEPTRKGKGVLLNDLVAQVTARSIRAAAGNAAGSVLGSLSGLGGQTGRAGKGIPDSVGGIFKGIGK